MSSPPTNEEIIRAARACTAVTCWFRHPGRESFAMWRIYGRDPFAIAISTTYGAVRAVFEDSPAVRIGPISYDHLPPIVDDIHTLFFHKRTEYSDEREVRTIQVFPAPVIERFPMAPVTAEQMNNLLAQLIAAPGMHPTMFTSILNIVKAQFDSMDLPFANDRLRRSDLDDDLLI